MPPSASEFYSSDVAENVRVEAQIVEVVPAPLAIKATAEQPQKAQELLRVALELPPDSGLVLVETTHAAPVASDEGEQPRPRRVRPARVAIVDEPLQMVETAPKDSTPPSAE
jgi:hypothetical protein